MPSSQVAFDRARDRVGVRGGRGSTWSHAGASRPRRCVDAVTALRARCFFTVDPASLLTTSHFQEGFDEIPAEWLGREFVAPDSNSMTEVLQVTVSGVGTLHEATGGPASSGPRKYHEEMQPFGCEQELVARAAHAATASPGARWASTARLGACPVRRDRDRPTSGWSNR